MSDRNQRLKELAAIAQLSQSFSAPQQQAESERQRNALSVLGLVMQHQQAEAQNKALQAHQEAVLAQQSSRGDDELKQSFLSHMMNDPGIPWSQKSAAISSLSPKLADPMKAMHESALNTAIQGRAPEFAGLYGQSRNDLPKLQKALGVLKSTMPAEIFNGQDWAGLNQGLPGAPVSGSISGREGGVLDQLNRYHRAASVFPTLIQTNRNRRASMTPQDLYNEDHPIHGLWNFLFGNPTQ